MRLVVLALAIAALGGCGGDSDDAPTTTTAAKPTASANGAAWAKLDAEQKKRVVGECKAKAAGRAGAGVGSDDYQEVMQVSPGFIVRRVDELYAIDYNRDRSVQDSCNQVIDAQLQGRKVEATEEARERRARREAAAMRRGQAKFEANQKRKTEANQKPETYSGNGLKNLGTIRVAEDSTLAWTINDGLIQVYAGDDGTDLLVNSQKNGSTRLPAGAYRNVEVNAVGDWTMEIRSH